MPHLHSFNLWNPTLRIFECPCGAVLSEEVLEANSPYGSAMFRSRIRALRALLYELWSCTNDCGVEVDLQRRILAEIRLVMPSRQHEQAIEALEVSDGSKNP